MCKYNINVCNIVQFDNLFSLGGDDPAGRCFSFAYTLRSALPDLSEIAIALTTMSGIYVLMVCRRIPGNYFGLYHATHSGVNRASDSGANHASDSGVNRATYFGANHATFFC
jgi:hypothetical protein